MILASNQEKTLITQIKKIGVDPYILHVDL